MGNFNQGAAPVGILAKALTGNIFVEKSLAFMNEGDKDGYNAYKHDISNILRARSVNPLASVSNTSVRQNYKRSLAVVESMETFDPALYHGYWKEFQPTGEFNWEGLPAPVQASMEELFLGSAATATEDLLTNNTTALLTGLIPQLKSNVLVSLNGANPTPTQIVNNTAISFRAHGGGTGKNLAVALTAANVFATLETVMKGQTKQMRTRANRKFMVSHGTADLIKEAQRLQLNFKGVDITEEGIMRYAGYEIIANPSFPDDTILFCSMSGDMKTDAIQLGTSLSSDFNNLTVDRVGPFSREWGMLLTFAIDIFVVRPEEICFYTTSVIV